MDPTRDLDAVAEAVIAAHLLIEEHGTREMKVLSRTLLFTVGQTIARRSQSPQIAAHPDPDDSGEPRRPFATRP